MSLTTVATHIEPVVRVRHIVCCAKRGGAEAMEDSTADTFVLPIRGTFVKQLSRNESVVADAASALFFAARRLHRISHPADGGDECLAFDFTPATLREVLVDCASADSFQELAPFAALSPGEIAARARIAHRMRHGAALDVEELSLEMLARAARVASRRAPSRRQRPDTIARRREQVNLTRCLLSSYPDRKWSLIELARAASTSPYHLARQFREIAGCSIHGYQLRLRVARAAELLLETRGELAAVALECGFASHSHFTSTFQRLLGVSPDAFRRADRSTLHEVRTNLKAR